MAWHPRTTLGFINDKHADQRGKGPDWGRCSWSARLARADPKQSKEFVNCVKNSEDPIVTLTGVEFLDKDGKPGFLERPVAVHYCNGGDITNFLTLSALSG